MTTSDGIAALSLVVAAIALWRSYRAEKRSEEAIIVIRQVWKGTPHLGAAVYPNASGGPDVVVDPNPMPDEPLNQSLSIDGMPAPGDGLELRHSLKADGQQPDRDGWRSYYVLLEVFNAGALATEVSIGCTVRGTFLPRFGAGVEKQDFPGQRIYFDAMPTDAKQYVLVRNLPGMPTALLFDSVTAAKKQPIRLVGMKPVEFQPRGYR